MSEATTAVSMQKKAKNSTTPLLKSELSTERKKIPTKAKTSTERELIPTTAKWIWIVTIVLLLAVGIFFIIWFVFIQKDDEIAERGWSPTTDCDPISPEFCQLPFPNNFWLNQDDNYEPTLLQFSDEFTPKSNKDPQLNISGWNLLNGFSPLPVIMTYFDDLSLINSPNIPYVWNFTESDTINSPVILLEVSTGKLIPNWIELDYSSLSGDIYNASAPDLLPITPANNLTLLINPAYRLNDGERYIVVISHLRDNDDELIQAADAFLRLRNNEYTATDDEQQRSRYYRDRIWNVLEENEIIRDDIQLCWDFTVMSTDYQTNAMVRMREDAYFRLEEEWDGNVQYTIINVTDDPAELAPFIGRKIIGTMTVPWYLNEVGPSVDARIVYEDDDDLLSDPVWTQNVQVEFELLIPYSILNGTDSPDFCVFGHGLFQTYATIEGLGETLNALGLIGGAVSFIGMSAEDQFIIVQALDNDLTDLVFMPNRLHQAMVNFLYLNKLMFSDNFINDEQIFSGITFPATYNNFYIGVSLGGIYGSVFLSLCSDITSGVLIVPGFTFELLLPRSSDFDVFWTLISLRFEIDVDRLFILPLIQLFWTQMSPSGYLSHLNDPDNLLTADDTVTNVLINYNLGDSQVSYLGAYNMGRSLNCSMYDSQIAEQNETIYGFEFISDDTIIDIAERQSACKIQGWYFEHPIIPLVNIPPKVAFNTHGEYQPGSREGVEYFFYQNKIDNSCYGPCIRTTNISDTNAIVNCSLDAGVFGLCNLVPYSLMELEQNTCYPTNVDDPDNNPCGYKLFCNCDFGQLVILFYENDPQTGEANCLNREKINANILYSNNAESCQPIVLGQGNKCVPDFEQDAHVTFDQDSLFDCCGCAMP